MPNSLYTQNFNSNTDIGRTLVINNDGFASPIGINGAKTIYRNADIIWKGTSSVNNRFLHFGSTGDNIFFGDNSGNLTTTGNNNVALGITTLASNTTGELNVAIGGSSLSNNTTGSNNTAFGTSSLLSNTTGELNIAIGRFAGNGNSIGGIPSHRNIDISGNIYIGSRTGANTVATGNTNSVAIGNLASFSSINTIVLGSVNGVNTAGVTQAVITGGVGVNPTAQLQVDSTNKGFLPPRMTTTQRNAIVSPAEGLVIHNTTTRQLNIFDGIIWKDLATGIGSVFTQNVPVFNPVVGNYSVYKSLYNATLKKIILLKQGGASITFNARKNKTSNHLATNAVINTNDNYVDVGALQNNIYAIGDEIEIMFTAIASGVNYVNIQLEFEIL